MAVTEQLAPTVRAMHVPRPGRGARRFVLGALLGVVLVLIALIAFRQSYADRILPGVRVGGIEVGGLTRTDARLALVAAFSRLEEGAVTVRSGVGNLVIPYAQVGRKVDYDTMVDRAAALGRDGTRFAETAAGLRLLVEPVSMPPVLSFDRDRLADALATYRDRVALRSVDAGVVATGSGFFVKRSVNGVQVDTTVLAPGDRDGIARSSHAGVVCDPGRGLVGRAGDDRSRRAAGDHDGRARGHRCPC